MTDIRIPIPELGLGLREALVIPYINMIDMQDNTYESDSLYENQVLVYSIKNKVKTWKITFPGSKWSKVLDQLPNPKHSVGACFALGEFSKRVTGIVGNTEIFVIDDVFYQRISWGLIGVRRQQGLVLRRKEEFSYFLLDCYNLNQEPLKSRILDGLAAIL